MNAVIPEEIVHLDFKPEQEEACIGYSFNQENPDSPDYVNTKPCPNAVKLYGVRRCCGMIDAMCLSCYNIMVKTRAAVIQKGRTIRHLDCNASSSQIAPFSQIEFK